MDMRGLSNFISELRKAGGKDQEQKKIDKELAKIRSKFKSGGKLKGYDRKKYICKLLYIHMMGYDIDFGHIEAVNLLSSDKYSEKHMGYLACTLLLNENHELVTLITNSMKRDLNSSNPNDQCLGLTAVANIGGKEQAETLAQDVQKLLVEGESKLLVKKKAALTMLRLYRKYPEILPAEQWAGRVIALLGARDFGVITAVMGLLLGLVENNPDQFKDGIPKVVRLLAKLVLNREYPTNYLYYGIPAPWLQVKLLRFLQYFDPPTDKGLMSNIAQVLHRSITGAERIKAMDKAKSVSRNNAAHSVFFEALNVLIGYDNDKAMLVGASKTLGRYLQDRDTNLRYLALDTLSRLALSMHPEVKLAIARHQDVVLFSLKDPDISIRRRALDLLYSMCNRENAGQIVGEMLAYLPLADYGIREELVLKIAILAEKFASEFTWYVDVILNLINQSGDFVSDDIWYRVVQIVTNRDAELQKYTASTVLNAVSSPAAHENAVKVAGYILGEFGYLITDSEQSSAQIQFDVLASKFEHATTVTKQLLLSTFIKFYNLYEDANLRANIREMFRKYSDVFDVELQQRANEYFQLVELGNYDLLATVLENMPAFPERESSVMKRILERQGASKIGKKAEKKDEEDDEEELEIENGQGAAPAMGVIAPAASGGDSLLELDETAATTTSAATARANNVTDLLSDFLGLDSAAPTEYSSQPMYHQQMQHQQPQYQQHPSYPQQPGMYAHQYGTPAYAQPAPAAYAQPAPAAPAIKADLDDLLGLGSMSTTPVAPAPVPVATSPLDIASAAASKAAARSADRSIEETLYANKQSDLSAATDRVYADAAKKFTVLLVSDSGVAIEDDHLQLTINSEYHMSKGRLSLEFGNKTLQALSQLRTQITETPALKIQFSQVAPLIAPNTKITQYVQLDCLTPFADPVELSLLFEANRQPYRYSIKLPIVAHKFIEPTKFADGQAFFEKWHSIPKGAPLEIQEVIRSPIPVNVDRCKRVVGDGFRVEVMSHIDANPQNFVAAGTFHSKQGNHIVMLRLETNPSAQAYRLTVRSTNELIAKSVHSLIKDQILRTGE